MPRVRACPAVDGSGRDATDASGRDAGAAGLVRAAADLDCPFLDGAGSGSLVGWGLRAVVASGLSADNCSQYCSSVSLSQSMLGQSSSSRFRC
jgi:hypothetical protein